MKNFIKFPYIKFRKSCLHNYSKWKYITREKSKQEKIKKTYLKYVSLVSKGKEKQADKLSESYEFDPLANILNGLISEFSLKEPNEENLKCYIDSLKSVGIDVQIIFDILFISSNDFSFCVKKLSKYEPEILKQLNDIEKTTRNGKCHPYGVVACLFLDALEDYKNVSLVTGKVFQLSPKAKYLHSWVEFLDEEKNAFVVDPTNNAVYLKDIFYDIHHVGETVNLSSSEVKRDYKIIKDLTDYDEYAVKIYYENPERGRKLYQKLNMLGEIGERENAKIK